MLVQACLILLLSSAVGIAVNTFRPDGLDLLNAQQSELEVDRESGEIALKDATLLFASGRAMFLDARSQWEFEQGHIQGAVSMPVDEFDYWFPQLESKLRAAPNLITYCDGERCPLGHELTEKLQAQGLDNVFVLKNGWTRWNTEGLPVEPSNLSEMFGHTKSFCEECN